MNNPTFNDLVKYINSGHPLDPAPVKLERDQLRELLNEVGEKIQTGERFEYEFTGRVVVTVADGRIEATIAAGNGAARAGDICMALFGLDGTPQEQMKLCEPCGNHFVGKNKKYCDDPCARKAWNKNMREKKK